MTENLKRATDTEFLHDWHALSQFGALPGGGVTRIAGSKEDKQQRDWFKSWLEARGFETRIDRVGNLYGLYEWNPGAPYILTGSHLDSQPNGGLYDGAYGVLASAFAAARVAETVEGLAATDANIREKFPFNIAVVDWFNEEGAYFTPSMMGSAVFSGKADPESVLGIKAHDGAGVKDALEEIGYLGEDDPPVIAGYAEIHVEQGRVLEDLGLTIGLVESTWAARKYCVTVTGEQSHTGSTAMADRKDALAAAAAFIVAVRELAFDSAPGDPTLHTAVSEMTVIPNSPVVVAREVVLNCDLRSPELDRIVAAEKKLTKTVEQIEQNYGVKIARELTHEWAPQEYSARGVDIAEEVVKDLGLSYQRMQTIAGHDSTNIKDVVPTVMLFIPSVKGIAHNIGEFTADQDCLDGIALLSKVLERMCAGELSG